MLSNNYKDAISKVLSRVLDILFVTNPKNTSLGVLFGIVIKQATDLIFYAFAITVRLSYVLCIAAGAFGFNIPSLFRDHRIDESLETAMHYITIGQKKGNFTAEEKRKQWRDFVILVNTQTQNSRSDEKRTAQE